MAIVAEYRLALAGRIVAFIFMPVFILAGLFLVGYGLIAMSGWIVLLFVLLGLFMIALFGYGLWDAIWGRFIIGDDRFTYKLPFGARTLMFDAVAGYRSDARYIWILPKDKREKQIKISKYYGRSVDVELYLDHRYANLNTVDFEQGTQEILDNPEFGMTAESRARRLEEARKVARYIRYGGWGVAAWVIFFPQPYVLAVGVTMALPLLVLVVCFYYRGLMGSDDTEKSAYPSVAVPFMMPSIVIALRALFDYNILEYANGWMPMGIVAAVLYVLYMIGTRGFFPRNKQDYATIFIIPFLTFAYSFGSFTVLNCQADRSEADVYATTVESKYIESGKTRTFHIKLHPWEGRNEVENVTVSEEEYNFYEEDNPVYVIQRPGWLYMPWIEITPVE